MYSIHVLSLNQPTIKIRSKRFEALENNPINLEMT